MNPIVELWHRRRLRSLTETIRYMRDAARGGLTSFLILGVIAGSYVYGKWLQTVPPDFPYAWVFTAFLLPVLVPSPVRTYVEPADTAFLQAAEHRMEPYFFRSMLYSFLLQSIVVILFVTGLWPLFDHFRAGAAPALGVLWAFFTAVKGLQLLAQWNEARLVSGTHRLIVRLLRWICTVAVVYTASKNPLPIGTALTGAGVAILVLLLMYLPRYRVAWEELIRQEERTRSRRYTVFNWFADVPQLQGAAKKRAFWTPVFRRFTLRSDNPYVHLFALTFLRSEMFGTYLRLTLFALFFMAVLRSPISVLLVWIVFSAASALQLSGLTQYHRLSIWPKLYPAAAEKQTIAQAALIRTALLVQSTVLGAAAILLSKGAVWLLVLALSYLADLVYSFFWTKRKLKPSRQL